MRRIVRGLVSIGLTRIEGLGERVHGGGVNLAALLGELLGLLKIFQCLPGGFLKIPVDRVWITEVDQRLL